MVWDDDIDRAGEGRTREDRDGMETRDIYKAVERKGRKRRRRVKGYLVLEIWRGSGNLRRGTNKQVALLGPAPFSLPCLALVPGATTQHATSDISSLKSPIAVYPDLIIENIP